VAACDLDGDKRDDPSLFPHGRNFRRLTEGKKKDLGIYKNFILKHLKYADAVARDFTHTAALAQEMISSGTVFYCNCLKVDGNEK
jgi:hypothetical protein